MKRRKVGVDTLLMEVGKGLRMKRRKVGVDTLLMEVGKGLRMKRRKDGSRYAADESRKEFGDKVKKDFLNLLFAWLRLCLGASGKPSSEIFRQCLSSFPQVEVMLGRIRKTFKRSFRTVSWMDTRTKAAAVEKAESMPGKIGQLPSGQLPL